MVWWRSVNKLLALVSFIIAISLHMYVKTTNNVSKEQVKQGRVYLIEQGGSDASKKANCRRAQKTDN